MRHDEFVRTATDASDVRVGRGRRPRHAAGRSRRGTAILGVLLALGATPATASDDDPTQRMIEEMMRAQGASAEDIAAMRGARAGAANLERYGTDVRYRIVGTYSGQPNLVGDPNGFAIADVTDRVEIDLVWRLTEGTLVGTPTFRNFESKLANARSPEPKCAPPTLHGQYEHAEFKAAEPGTGADVFLHYETRHPPVDVVQFCTGGTKRFGPRRGKDVLQLVIPTPLLLDTMTGPTEELRVSPDRKSLIVESDGWTWTFTPVPKG